MSTERKEEQTTNAQPTQTNGVAPTGETTQQLIATLQQNWQREMQGMRTYRELAHNERDPTRRNVLEKLAEAHHAQNGNANLRSWDLYYPRKNGPWVHASKPGSIVN